MCKDTTANPSEIMQESYSITSSCDKPIILAFIGNYLPGYKAGGILRTMVNTVDHLCDEFEFRIVTRDRDLGDDKPYIDIKLNQWQQVGNAMVYYLPPKFNTERDILRLIISTKHHLLYLNSFFDPFTIKVLLKRKLKKTAFKPVIVAPCGEFAWASLKQKYPKKFIFIQAAKILGLYNDIVWRSSSEFEKLDIIKIMNAKPDTIHVTGDLPIKKTPDLFDGDTFPLSPDCIGLRIVFLSRISREKNLDYALKILSKVRANLVFDIYGPAENGLYWKECQELICQLPANVKVKYCGVVNPNQVLNIFSHYDLFLFPTGGENYGHVIAECLTSGTPVLISTKTPWRNLQADGLGWDIDLVQKDSFVEVIEKLALMSGDERMEIRDTIKVKITERLLDPVVLEANRQLFKFQIGL
jgi:glycosyltransferase involved in cell wall biosynthesis